MEYQMSLDTALTLVNGMREMKWEEMEKSSNPTEKERLSQEIKMLSKEEKLLYGIDDFARLSVMDKVDRLYSPILKEYYKEA